MMTRRLRSAAIAAMAVASLAVAATPTGASASPGSHHRTHSSHHRSQVRLYDLSLLVHSNTARTTDRRHHYKMNHRLWKVAHAWAKHLAATGVLEHNPKLAPDLGKACPDWTAIGENVGVVYGGSVNELFQAYMHSPPHRANILDKHYSQVGIATVKVTRNGQVEQWDVMDFGNHC
jgi:uncharacterized protein YkwD